MFEIITSVLVLEGGFVTLRNPYLEDPNIKNFSLLIIDNGLSIGIRFTSFDSTIDRGTQ